MTDAGRHPNIKLLTLAEIEQIGGYVGNFKVRIRQRPRFVREKECTACGDCEKACPVEIPGRFDEQLVRQKAAHKLYPQAVPNAYAIEKKGVSPCRDACATRATCGCRSPSGGTR